MLAHGVWGLRHRDHTVSIARGKPAASPKGNVSLEEKVPVASPTVLFHDGAHPASMVSPSHIWSSLPKKLHTRDRHGRVGKRSQPPCAEDRGVGYKSGAAWWWAIVVGGAILCAGIALCGSRDAHRPVALPISQAASTTTATTTQSLQTIRCPGGASDAPLSLSRHHSLCACAWQPHQFWVLMSAIGGWQPLPILPVCLFVCLSAQAAPTRTGPDCRRGRPPTDLPTGQPADRSTDWLIFDFVGKVPHHSHFVFLKNLPRLRDGLVPEVTSGSMLARMERRLCKDAAEWFRPRFAVITGPRQTVDGAARMLRPFAARLNICLV